MVSELIQPKIQPKISAEITMRLCQAIPGLSTVEIFVNQQKKIALTPYGMFFRVAAGPTPSRVSHRAPKVGDTDQNPPFSAEFSAESYTSIALLFPSENGEILHRPQ